MPIPSLPQNLRISKQSVSTDTHPVLAGEQIVHTGGIAPGIHAASTGRAYMSPRENGMTPRHSFAALRVSAAAARNAGQGDAPLASAEAILALFEELDRAEYRECDARMAACIWRFLRARNNRVRGTPGP
jgi:hypothetical protein